MIHVLFGAGGFSNEIRIQSGEVQMPCFVDDKYLEEDNENNIHSLSAFNPVAHEVIVAVGDSKDRSGIVKRLPKETSYWSFTQKSSQLFAPIHIGFGTVIMSNCILAYKNTLGNHVHLNMGTILGHDSVMGDFSTTALGVLISGNVTIGKRVYLGNNCNIKQKLTICDDVTIGMGAVVLEDITEPGTYVGSPAKRIK